MFLLFMSFLSFFCLFIDYSYLFVTFVFSSLYCLYMYGGYSDGLFYIDFLNLLLVFIGIWVVLFSLFSMQLSLSLGSIFLFMLAFIVLSFTSSNYLLFYLSFEFVFFLMFFFLVSWGNSGERYQASFYMFFYTMVFSLPFLIMLVDCFYNLSGYFIMLGFFSYTSYLLYFLFFVFIVKLPLFGFHLWLPKAHVEAPVSGSMLLAGVLLKLGGYGILRFLPLVDMFQYGFSFFYCFLFYLALFGSLVVSIFCVRQMDLKMLIAYSSVVHMGIMLLGIFSFSLTGELGAILMMVAHGFISPVLFLLLTVMYDYYYSRSAMMLKGVIISSSIFCLFWFGFCCLNLSVPPFMSFFSEVLILSSLGFVGLMEWTLMFFCCFFTGVYCIYLYVIPSHGSELNHFFSLSFSTLTIVMCSLVSILIYPCFFFLP